MGSREVEKQFFEPGVEPVAVNIFQKKEVLDGIQVRKVEVEQRSQDVYFSSSMVRFFQKTNLIVLLR